MVAPPHQTSPPCRIWICHWGAEVPVEGRSPDPEEVGWGITSGTLPHSEDNPRNTAAGTPAVAADRTRSSRGRHRWRFLPGDFLLTSCIWIASPAPESCSARAVWKRVPGAGAARRGRRLHSWRCGEHVTKLNWSNAVRVCSPVMVAKNAHSVSCPPTPYAPWSTPAALPIEPPPTPRPSKVPRCIMRLIG